MNREVHFGLVSLNQTQRNCSNRSEKATTSTSQWQFKVKKDLVSIVEKRG